MKTRMITPIVGLSLLAMVTTACGTAIGAVGGAGAGAAVAAGTGHDPGKGALIGAGIDEKTHRDVCLASPDVSLEGRDTDDVKTIKTHVPIRSLANMVGKNALTPVVRWRLGELAGTGDVAATDVEPVTLHPPLRNVSHCRAPFANVGAS